MSQELPRRASVLSEYSEVGQANCKHHRRSESLWIVVASSSNSLKGAHAHAISTRPSFPARGAGSEASYM